MSRYLNSPKPELHTDRAAIYQRAIDLKHTEYHRRIAAKQSRSIAVVMMLIFAVVLVVLVIKAIELFRP